MTALIPLDMIETVDRFCIYGVANDYDTMIELVRYRVAELQTTHESIDEVSGLHGGYSGKILAPIPIKSMGKVSLGPMLQTLGLALIVVRDDEQFQRVKDRLTKRERPRLANASSTKPTWLFKRKKAREYGKKRWAVLTEDQRKKLARKMGKASGLARRRKARKSQVIHAE